MGEAWLFLIESKSLFINREDPAIRNQLEPGDHDWKCFMMVLGQWGLIIRLNKVEFLNHCGLMGFEIHIC